MKKSLLAALVFGLVVLVGGCAVPAASSTTSSTQSTATTLSQESTTTLPGSSTTLATGTTTVAGALTFSATLSGASELPPVKTSASGTLTLTVDAAGSTVHYVLKLSKLSNVTVARLHEGAAGTTGATILTLYTGPTKKGVFSGVLVQGSFTAKNLGGPLKGKKVADLVSLIRSGKVYLNVGTSTHTNGAIRGQVQ